MNVAVVSHRRAIPVKSSGLQLHDSLCRFFNLKEGSFKLGAGNGYRFT
jgi:hypothetical protein